MKTMRVNMVLDLDEKRGQDRCKAWDGLIQKEFKFVQVEWKGVSLY